MQQQDRNQNIDNRKEEKEIQEEMCNIPDGIIKTLKDDVAEIKTALLGSKYQKKGLIERVEQVEYEIERLQNMKYKIYGGAIVLATIVSVLFRIVIRFV